MKKVKPTVVKNAGELARALDLPELSAREWEARTQLTDKLIELVAKEKLTHAQLAKQAGTSRTRITAILNRNLHEVSTDLLLRILGAMGYRVGFIVTRAKLAA